jgi:hypothetical protein
MKTLTMIGTKMEEVSAKDTTMETVKKSVPVNDDNQKWENPANPEAPSDEREKEQIERQFEEAKRRNENLTDSEEIEKHKH